MHNANVESLLQTILELDERGGTMNDWIDGSGARALCTLPRAIDGLTPMAAPARRRMLRAAD